jgi:hypothetical protein
MENNNKNQATTPNSSPNAQQLESVFNRFSGKVLGFLPPQNNERNVSPATPPRFSPTLAPINES